MFHKNLCVVTGGESNIKTKVASSLDYILLHVVPC